MAALGQFFIDEICLESEINLLLLLLGSLGPSTVTCKRIFSNYLIKSWGMVPFDDIHLRPPRDDTKTHLTIPNLQLVQDLLNINDHNHH